MKSGVTNVVVLIGAMFFGVGCVHSEPPTAVEAHVKLIDTGLAKAVPSGVLFLKCGTWIDEDRIAIDARPQSGTEEEKLRFGSVRWYDLRTGKSKEVEPRGSLVSWDDTTNEFVVRHLEITKLYKPGPWPATIIKVDDNGDVLARTPIEESSWNSWESWAERLWLPKEQLADGWKMRLRKGLYIASGKHKEAILHKADGTIKELGIPLSAINNMIDNSLFLPFANRYQLNHPKCHAAAPELHADAMCEPLYLMSPEGEIETLNFPNKLRDALGQFDFTYAVKNGVLIRTRFPGKQGYYLWRNNVLYELWRSREGGPLNALPYEFWGGEVISPGGCKVAFFKAWDSKETTQREVYIFDLCEIKN